MGCELCEAEGGERVWGDARCRVVLVGEPGYPGFCRVIWKRHVAEMTDLADADRVHLMRVVFGVERALRELLRPDKVNLASLGNVTPTSTGTSSRAFATTRIFPTPSGGRAQARRTHRRGRPPPASSSRSPPAWHDRETAVRTES
jgi:hypothetical protein